MRMEHQSPHLLDTMEQVISFLHADWQQLQRDRDNLHDKLKRWALSGHYSNHCQCNPQRVASDSGASYGV